MHLLRYLRCLLPAIALAPCAAGADEPPVLRYTSYLLVALDGKPARVLMQSGAYATANKDYVYRDQPSYAVIGAEGQLLDEIDGTLGGQTSVTVPVQAGTYAAVEVRPGNNYCTARPDGPYAYVATAASPLSVVRGFERLYFLVPAGLTDASISFHAFSVGEAARAIVYDADGKVAAEAEEDYNEPGTLTFRVPEGQAGRVWSLALAAPKRADWKLDDCKLWLGESLTGVLAPKPEWAERLDRPFAVSWRPLLDFEGANPVTTVQWSKPPPAGAALPAFKVDVSPEQAHAGRQALRVEMTFPESGDADNELKLFTKPLDVAGVRRVKLWLYGDGSGRKLTLRVRDAANQHHYCPAGAMEFRGWHEVSALFPAGGKPIAGGKVAVVLHVGHAPGQPRHSVFYVDDLAVAE